ncbi:zinc finger FYVE domain-containing protein [Chloropicon primus]|uniref:Uncharacterized protein n=1 Tax=Chloropicon primus TaxID=1764295 RepID=A0A5B8MK10_9CHLO|nr:hypothetical protein A3770_03p22380 [Chloropicon primus]UPQ98931.1 zinc finger FYVE domain-containing protein [Chloropicon primus]|eukprot:QDZ19720.1 hypothetical protein A3770_03p22380 [Chloropicon primus]
MPENDGVNRSHWKDCADISECESTRCNASFSLTNRKHHCRKCGKVFCGKCTNRRLPLNPRSLTVDFQNGNDCRVCQECYNEERQWSKRDQDEARKSKKAVRDLAEKLQMLRQEASEERARLLDELDELREELDETLEGKSALETRVRELESHLASTALFAQVHKRKIRSDSTTTPWKERLVVASPSGIKYYKAQQSIGSVDLSSLSLVTGCIQSKHSSPVKGQSSSGLQMITKDGTIYEFSMPNGEQDVDLWQKHVDLLMQNERESNPGTPVAVHGHEAAHLSENEIRKENPFKMGWLSKQPGKTGFWQKRWFVVSDGLIAYYKSKSIINPIQQLSLVNAEARQISVPGKSLWCFQLFVPTTNRLFVMEAPSSEELASWLSAIKGGATYAKSLKLGEGNVSGQGARTVSDDEGSLPDFDESGSDCDSGDAYDSEDD